MPHDLRSIIRRMELTNRGIDPSRLQELFGEAPPPASLAERSLALRTPPPPPEAVVPVTPTPPEALPPVEPTPTTPTTPTARKANWYERFIGADPDMPYERRMARMQALADISEGLSETGAALVGAQGTSAAGLRQRMARLEGEEKEARKIKSRTAESERKFQQDREMAEAARQHAKGMAEEGRKFESEEAEKGRKATTERDVARQLYETGEKEKGREFEKAESALERESRKEIAAARLTAPTKARPRLIPSSTADKLAMMKTTLGAIENVKKEYDAAASMVGPAESRGRSFWGKITGKADPKFRTLESDLEQIIADFVVLKTGLAATDKQMRFYKGMLGQTFDSPPRFHAAMDAFARNLERGRGNLLGTVGQAGYDVTGFPEEPAPVALPATGAPGPAGPTSGGVTMVLPNGREIPNIHPGQIQAFMRDHPGSQPKREGAAP